MDDSGPRDPTDLRKRSTVLQESRSERPLGDAGARMHHYARGLAHHEEGLILVDDVQVSALGERESTASPQELRWTDGRRDEVSRRLRRLAVHENGARFHQAVNPGAGQVVEGLRESLVHPQPGETFVRVEPAPLGSVWIRRLRAGAWQ